MAQGVHDSDQYKPAFHACPFDPRWAGETENSIVCIPFWEGGGIGSYPFDVGPANSDHPPGVRSGWIEPIWTTQPGDEPCSLFFNLQGETGAPVSWKYDNVGNLVEGAFEITVAMRASMVGQSTYETLKRKTCFGLYSTGPSYRMVGFDYMAQYQRVYTWLNDTSGMPGNGFFGLGTFKFWTGVDLFDGSIHSVVLTWASDGGYPNARRQLWIDGLLAAQSNVFYETAGPLTSAVPIDLEIGGAVNLAKADAGLLGYVSSFSIWTRKWHPGEIRAWTADPFGMVRPMARPPGPARYMPVPPVPSGVVPDLDWFDPETGEPFSTGEDGAPWLDEDGGVAWLDSEVGKAFMDSAAGAAWRSRAEGAGWFDSETGVVFSDGAAAADWRGPASGAGWQGPASGADWHGPASGADWQDEQET